MECGFVRLRFKWHSGGDLSKWKMYSREGGKPVLVAFLPDDEIANQKAVKERTGKLVSLLDRLVTKENSADWND